MHKIISLSLSVQYEILQKHQCNIAGLREMDFYERWISDHMQATVCISQFEGFK